MGHWALRRQIRAKDLRGLMELKMLKRPRRLKRLTRLGRLNIPPTSDLVGGVAILLVGMLRQE